MIDHAKAPFQSEIGRPFRLGSLLHGNHQIGHVEWENGVVTTSGSVGPEDSKRPYIAVVAHLAC